VATLANGKTVLLWDDVFYYFEKNACTEFLDLKEETVREMLVPIGKDGFICLVKAKPHLIVPGKDPVKLIDENFYELTPGPRDSVILRRPESWAPGRRDILLFPETGRVIAFNDAIFGSPSTEVQHVCYEPASDKIIGTYWDEILAVPAAQLV
jgi:hypothetical protein